jgi:hypothetical protein
MDRKGAFELSLSFIIIVVFAVIVLSLAIAWIQGIFGGISPLTHQVTDVARQQLLETIAQSDRRVDIAAPDVTKWKRGETGSYAVGVRNVHSDQDKAFSMNVYLEEIGGALAGKSASAYASSVEKWLTFSKDIFVSKSSSETSDIIIKPPANADTGIYMFRIVVCDAGTCRNLDSGGLYGSAQFTIEIEAV